MRTRRTESGVSLVAALFLVVVLSVLGGYLVNLSLVQHGGSAMSVQVARAWAAAQSGLEWIAYRAINDNACPAGMPVSFDSEGFTIVIDECTAHDITEGASGYRLFEVSARAYQGSYGSPNYVSRSLRATIGGP